MYRTILVPLDGSYLSEQVLPLATVLARQSEAALVLVRAAWATVLPGGEPGEAQFLAAQEAEQYLMSILGRLTAQGVRAQMTVPYGPAADGILTEIELRRPDLVVMCTHGRSGLGRWVYGSVAEAVLARSPVPVLLVRPAGSPGRVALESDRPRLLVPLDGSPFSEAALPYAVELARDFNATLVLCRAVVAQIMPRTELTLAPPYISEALLQEQKAEAEGYLAGVAESLHQQGLRAQTIVRVEAAADAILDEAKRNSTAMIVMTTHGRTGLGRLIFGSVAMDVLQRGRLPLVLVRPPGLIQAESTPKPAQVVSQAA